MATRSVRTPDGATLCAEERGGPGQPALLLLPGSSWSMDFWDPDLCDALAARGRRVLRVDPRDTGRSTHDPVGAPGYGGDELVADVLAVLDAFGVEAAHLVGLSMGGGIAQTVAVAHRDRVASLTLLATSPIDPTVGTLPGPEARVLEAMGAEPPPVDWADREAAIEHIVARSRPYAGPRGLEAARLRAAVARMVDRSEAIEAAQVNHGRIAHGGPAEPRLAALEGLPALVVHGDADPLFPLAHGEALAAAIPGARLLVLDGVGHELPPARCWPALVEAIVAVTGG